MTDIFLKIKAQLEKEFAFAVYSKPGSDIITGIFQNNALQHHSENLSEEGFVFAPFNNGNIILIPFKNAEVITDKIVQKSALPPEPKTTVVDVAVKSDFETLVQKSIDAINAGDFKKLVTSRRETVALINTDNIAIFKQLLATYPNAFQYCFYSPESGLWMGATPEQLLKVNSGTMHTVALAGTQLYNTEALIWEDKEKQEQQFVTDYITDSLKHITQEIVTSQPYTYRAGNLVHIKTDITAALNSGTLNQVVKSLHPTPAVCGLPKTEAQHFLLEHEGYDRAFYSGFLGEINKNAATGEVGQTDLFVNLRCMKIENEKAHLYIGCGITKDSNPEKEFIETVNKSMTMRRVLQ